MAAREQRPIELVRLLPGSPEAGRPIGGIYCRCGHHDIDHINPDTGWPRGACCNCDCEQFAYRDVAAPALSDTDGPRRKGLDDGQG